MNASKHYSTNEDQTQALALKLLKEYESVNLWLLEGNLGSGKTNFVKGIATALQLDPKLVNSPTFTYMEDYGPFIHIDLYRMEESKLLLDEIILEHLQEGRRLFIEWPARMKALFKHKHIHLQFEYGNSKNERLITVDQSMSCSNK